MVLPSQHAFPMKVLKVSMMECDNDKIIIFFLCTVLSRINIQFLFVNKSNKRTEFQIYWYYGSTCSGQPFRPSLGVLSRKLALVHFTQLWWPDATRNRMELQFHPVPGSKRSSKLHKMYQCRCTAKNSWWWAERLPETCRAVIRIKLEFSASVGFINKEFVTMHGHVILKNTIFGFMHLI